MDLHREHLRTMVRNTEGRYLYYKSELESLYKSGLAKTDPAWMTSLKEMGKLEEKQLKSYREEIEFYNQGLNPPFCYKQVFFNVEK